MLAVLDAAAAAARPAARFAALERRPTAERVLEMRPPIKRPDNDDDEDDNLIFIYTNGSREAGRAASDSISALECHAI